LSQLYFALAQASQGTTGLEIRAKYDL